MRLNMASLEGEMLLLNEAGCSILGIAETDVLQTNIMDVIPDPWATLVQNQMFRTLEHDGHWEGDLQYTNLKTKELVDVHAITFHIYDPDSSEPQFLANLSELFLIAAGYTVLTTQNGEEAISSRGLSFSLPEACRQHNILKCC